ncbi:DUF7009 family protein [Portibacter lacus]|uniref:Uncharacterized protein n=1 Tax=Portibacter lacus TaxID=1099794 RepID=A0AA37SJ21_9BACT|nr:hypothetical protein [Portibacter lacus]GLR15653.1 hypothetical protein GCM10007940_02680 [Portibacter lacus]
MKVRILNQSIRFRVSMDEMDLIVSNGAISSSILFPSGQLTFQVHTHPEKHSIDQQNQNCQLFLNKEEVSSLHGSDQVSISFSQNDLKVVFEKDFKCLTQRDENEDHLYPNPKGSH